MSLLRVCAAVLCVVISVNCDFVTRKLCRDVDVNWCHVHGIDVDPCRNGPQFCRVNTDKPYKITVDFTPNFFSPYLKLVMLSDEKNDDSFVKEVKVDGCGPHQNCEVEPGERRNLTAHFSLNKSYSYNKFPIKMYIKSEREEEQMCCFSFSVKIKK